MIATRKRKPRRSPAGILVPLVLLAAACGVAAFPPARAAVTGSPLARPLTFAMQQNTIAERNRQIRELRAQLEEERRTKSSGGTGAEQLARNVAAKAPAAQPVVAAPASPSSPAPAPARSAAPAGGQEKREAATWSAMDPDKAAAMIQKLPDEQVVRVLDSMDPDAAGAILEALPPGVAARLSRSPAQLGPLSGR